MYTVGGESVRWGWSKFSSSYTVRPYMLPGGFPRMVLACLSNSVPQDVTFKLLRVQVEGLRV